MAHLNGKAGSYPLGRTPVLFFIGVFLLCTMTQLFWCAPSLSGILREAAPVALEEKFSHPDTVPLPRAEFMECSGREASVSGKAVRRTCLLTAQTGGEDDAEASGMPESPHPDLGRMSLSQVCARYGLDLAEVLKTLADNEINASADMSLSRIAEENDLSPLDVYELIREVAERDSPVTPESDESK